MKKQIFSLLLISALNSFAGEGSSSSAAASSAAATSSSKSSKLWQAHPSVHHLMLFSSGKQTTSFFSIPQKPKPANRKLMWQPDDYLREEPAAKNWQKQALIEQIIRTADAQKWTDEAEVVAKPASAEPSSQLRFPYGTCFECTSNPQSRAKTYWAIAAGPANDRHVSAFASQIFTERKEPNKGTFFETFVHGVATNDNSAQAEEVDNHFVSQSEQQADSERVYYVLEDKFRAQHATI